MAKCKALTELAVKGLTAHDAYTIINYGCREERENNERNRN